jgi:uncharacterized protein (TIGR02266 family)
MRIVVPVRYAAHDRMAQTTSRELTDSSMLVACERRPRPKEMVALRLYLPDSHPPAMVTAKVREEAGEGFWIDFVDAIFGVAERIQTLVSRCASRKSTEPPSAHRIMARFPAAIPVSIEGDGKLFAAKALNVSSSGVFVGSTQLLDPGSLVAMKMLIGGGDDPVAVQARVVHAVQQGLGHSWSKPGFGLQFIDGDDSFRARIDRYLRLAQPA